MKHLIPIILVGLLTACFEKEEKAPPPKPLPVTVAKPSKREVVIYREFPATLVGAQEIEIEARVKGILSLAADAPDFEGNPVKKGTPLFTIEPEPYLQATNAAQAAVERAVASRNLAEKRYERVKRAGKTKAVAEVDVEIAAAEFAETEAAVAQAQAQLEEAKITEAYTQIAAPIDGRISRLFVDPGNLVGASGTTLLATIIDDSTMLAYFEVPERPLIRFLAHRTPDREKEPVYQAEIRLKLADGKIYSLPGKIDYIENEVDPMTRTAKVRAVFPNPDYELAAGLYGLVGYPAGPNPEDPEQTEALLVPSSSVLRDLAGNYVWIVDEKNIVRRRGVETGSAVEKPTSSPEEIRTMETVIVKGLTGEESVIVSGLQRAREGAPVTPQPAGQAPQPAGKALQPTEKAPEASGEAPPKSETPPAN